jgi:hypothetical protein
MANQRPTSVRLGKRKYEVELAAERAGLTVHAWILRCVDWALDKEPRRFP